MTNYRKYYTVISIATIIIASFIAWHFKFYEDKGEMTALIDVSLTSIALIIAILEILMVRSITESSNKAVSVALGRIAEIVSVSDISRGIKTAYEIQKYLRSEQSVIAHIRMQDLKFIIIPLKSDQRFSCLDASKRLPNVVSTLTIDINNLESILNREKNKVINVSKINSNLEELVSILIEYENLIKSI